MNSIGGIVDQCEKDESKIIREETELE